MTMPDPSGTILSTPATGGARDLVRVDGLEVVISTPRGSVHAVQDVSLRVGRNELVGIVGESGSGKTITALSIIGLLPPAARVMAGSIMMGETDLAQLSEKQRGRMRGAEVSMVFQDAASYLNPLIRVGDQVAESFRIHQKMDRRKAREAAIEMLGEMRIPDPRRVARRYPFELSGGQRQRVLIATALACRPSLVIADEPTSALDVITQEQILDLLFSIVQDFDTSMLLITHDLAIVGNMCDRVYVMYAGQVMEHAGGQEALAAPSHPYTQGLVGSMLAIDEYKETIPTISGSVPDLRERPDGCPFAPRCAHVWDLCRDSRPARFPTGPGRDAACWLWEEGGE